MAKLRIGFLGGRILGYKCLEILRHYQNQVDVPLIIPHTKPGVLNSDWNPPLQEVAKFFSKDSFWIPSSLKEPRAFERFKTAKPDVVFNAFCNRIIPQNILEIPRLGTINFHYGKLPKYRGRFIVNHIILEDESTTCATAHFMTEKVDEGDIIAEQPVVVASNDTAKTLYLRCTDAATNLFQEILEKLLAGKDLPRSPQGDHARYFPFQAPNNCELDVTKPWEQQERFIRALTFPPISSPWILIGGKRYAITPIEDE